MSKEFVTINFENILRAQGTLQRHRKGVYTQVVDCTLASEVLDCGNIYASDTEDMCQRRGKTMQTAGQPGFRCICPIEAFTEAVMTNDREAIEQSRNALEAAIGPAGIIDTAAVIAMFNVVDRVADSTGIPIDAASREFRYGVGQELGMTHLTPEARAR